MDQISQYAFCFSYPHIKIFFNVSFECFSRGMSTDDINGL